jgi:hypothetical protein
MHKVVVERPRGGQGWAKKFPRPQMPFDDLPKYQGIKRPHEHRKWFTDLLGPLRRWLRSQVGRPWNDVYSEACAVIKPDSVVRAHIKTHLLDFVLRDTFLREGEVWCFARYRWFGTNELQVSLLATRWTGFYVHPATGALCEIPPRRRARWRDKSTDELMRVQRWVDDATLLCRLNGSWFECRMEAFPVRDIRHEGPLRFDLNTHRLLSRDDAKRLYGRAVRCVAKRQLSRRELRRHGLVNTPASAHSSSHSPWSVMTPVRKPAQDFINHNPQPRRSYGKPTAHPRRRTAFSRPPASDGRASRPRRRSNAVTASCTATRNCARSWVAMTFAPAARDAGFRNCCLRAGRFDGALRNHYFRE